MRAFVTGSTGFLGTNLVRELVARGWDVVALQRRPSPWLRDVKIAAATGDVTDIDSLRRAMPDGLDAVFHVAGDTSLWSRARERQYRVNVEGTRNVAAVALEKHARKFVQTSSIAAFGHHHTGKEPDLTRDGARLVCATVLSDCSKAVRELGYRPVALETMLRDCHEWMQSAGMLAR